MGIVGVQGWMEGPGQKRTTSRSVFWLVLVKMNVHVYANEDMYMNVHVYIC